MKNRSKIDCQRHSSFTQSVSHRGEARQLERRAFRHEYLFSPEGAIGMRFSTRGRRRKFCDEGAALSPPPPPFSRVPSPPPSLPCLALLAWLSSCWYLHPIVAPTTFVSSSSFSLFLSLSFFLCFSLRLRPPSSAAPPGMLRLNSAPLAATAPRWPCCHPSVCTRPRMAIAEKARNDTATPPFCRDQASRLHRVVRGGEAR